MKYGLKESILASIISWAAVLFWMILIFSLSAQTADKSDGLSKKATEIIIKTIGKFIDIETINKYEANPIDRFNHIVRKCAHGTIYLVLGILVMNAARRSGILGYKAFLFSLGFCILYAASDEFHQLFVAGRGAQLSDVLIDSTGSAAGILVFSLIGGRASPYKG